MAILTPILIFIGIIILIIIITSLKVINEYERGVRFTLGRYSGIMSPGLNFLLPIFQSFRRVDIRQTTIELPPQEVMTKDR
jgi:regulator of protease activity HflC (stomatin/prohibitin superfamily)